MKARVVWFLLAFPVLLAVAWGIGSALAPDGVERFLDRYWLHPIPPQGTPPTAFSPLEASLDPAACGQCHVQQYNDWRTSLHSHAMGAGIDWQLRLADADTARACLRCHAPLSEQLALLAQERGWSKTDAPPPDYIPDDLHRQGLVCAACHLRGHVHHGPPLPADRTPLEDAPHNGFVPHQAFRDSRFCAHCHQFPEDGPRLAGKLREDTYNQWRASPAAARGQQCQDCHMPERRHLWRGIHDPEMTRSAFAVEWALMREAGQPVGVRARVVNQGAGHHLPTYLVAEILLLLEYRNPAGKIRELARHTLAWRANLALDGEIFDQRLPAGAGVTLEGRDAALTHGGTLRLRVRVAPRHHYIRTFEHYLRERGDGLEAAVRERLIQAIQEGRATEYQFVAAEYPLPTIAN
jgi:hypothetical protein